MLLLVTYTPKKRNYSEEDPLNLGITMDGQNWWGVCSSNVQKFSNIRICMTEKPFLHKKAYANVKSNFIYQEDAAKLIIKIIKKKGVINIGGPSKTIYNFAKKDKKSKKIFSKGEFPKRMDMRSKKI